MRLSKNEKMILSNIIDHEIEYLESTMRFEEGFEGMYDMFERDIKELTKIKEKLES